MKITLSNYIAYTQLSENVSEDKIVCTLLGLDISSFNELKADEVDNIKADLIKWLKRDEIPFKERFRHNGIEYGFIPNLDEITYGENKDLCSYIGVPNMLNRAMAVAYRPITQTSNGKYLIEKYEGSGKYSKSFDDLDVDMALGMQVFFYNLTNALQDYILNYSLKVAQNLPSSVLNGQDTKSYTHWHKATLDDLMK